MKHVLLFLIATLFIFSGCRKNFNSEIILTRWRYIGNDHYEVIRFETGKEMRATGSRDGMDYQIEGTYQYDKPDIIINLANGSILTGTINGNTMHISNGIVPEATYFRF